MSRKLPNGAGQLPVHGFVLAGGKSTRMGADKALLRCGGRLMVAVAVEKLRAVCVQVSIAGNREDLTVYAPVIREQRVDAGPAAGIEAGLMAAQCEWALFLPVDVPLVPAEMLRRWYLQATERPQVRASYLRDRQTIHPALCLLHRECLPAVSTALDAGDRKLSRIFAGLVEGLWIAEAREFVPAGAEDVRLLNVNTPADLERASDILKLEGPSD